jgi:hypothetical protein
VKSRSSSENLQGKEKLRVNGKITLEWMLGKESGSG